MTPASQHGEPTLPVTDMGIPVDAAEARATTVTVSDAGALVNIVAQGWVLAVDPDSGTCRQIPLPGCGFPFAAISTSDGTTVTGGSRFGTETEQPERYLSWIAEIDPVSGDVRSRQVCPGEQLIGLGLAEAPDGAIWFTTYPSALLVRWDRRDDTVSEPLRLTETEQYPTHLAIADDGWIYIGIGTTSRSVVALPHHGGEPVVLLHSPLSGCGYVRRGTDGQVYGHIDSDNLHPTAGLRPDWYRFEQASAVRVDEPAAGFVTGAGFDRVHQAIPAPWTVESVDLAHHRLVTMHPQPRTTRLSYRSGGAELSPFRLGPTGRIHGTSNHPLQLFDADPATGSSSVYGQAPVAEAGGNVCAWATWRDRLVGVAYTGGHLYLLDPREPVTVGENPVHLGAHPEAGRPRCVVVLGDTAVWSGYGDYGHSGGGLVISELPSGRSEVIGHHGLAPHQGITALCILDESAVLAGSSIESPGGAPVQAAEAVASVIDVRQRRMLRQFVPLPGVRTWSAACLCPDGLVHLVSDVGHHVLVDPHEGRTVQELSRVDLGGYAFGGFVVDDELMWVIAERGISRVDLRAHRIDVIHESSLPLTAGGALVGDALLVGSGSHLLSIGGVR